MVKPVKKNRDKNIASVKDCRERLKKLGVKNAKTKFFNTYYGKMLYSDFNRLDNLWMCRITDEEFTNRLKQFIWDNEKVT